MRPLRTPMLVVIMLGLADCSSDGSTSESSSGTVASSTSAAPSTMGFEVGAWQLDESATPESDSHEVAIAVSRVGCSSGATGQVAQTSVALESDRIVITALWELPSGPVDSDVEYSCQLGRAVPVVVQLGEELGKRELVDGGCLQGRGVGTVHCEDGPVKWIPGEQDTAPAMTSH